MPQEAGKIAGLSDYAAEFRIPNDESARASKIASCGIFRLQEALGCLTVWFAPSIVFDGPF
jgi:hypothetical protein